MQGLSLHKSWYEIDLQKPTVSSEDISLSGWVPVPPMDNIDWCLHDETLVRHNICSLKRSRVQHSCVLRSTCFCSSWQRFLFSCQSNMFSSMNSFGTTQFWFCLCGICPSSKNSRKVSVRRWDCFCISSQSSAATADVTSHSTHMHQRLKHSLHTSHWKLFTNGSAHCDTCLRTSVWTPHSVQFPTAGDPADSHSEHHTQQSAPPPHSPCGSTHCSPGLGYLDEAACLLWWLMWVCECQSHSMHC